MAVQGWGPAESITRQLRWCAALAAGEPREERPGAFSMGLIATREFDMYGDRPELASLINEVQRGSENCSLGNPRGSGGVQLPVDFWVAGVRVRADLSDGGVHLPVLWG